MASNAKTLTGFDKTGHATRPNELHMKELFAWLVLASFGWIVVLAIMALYDSVAVRRELRRLYQRDADTLE